MKLNKKSEESVFLATGISCNELTDMDFEEIDKRISKKTGKKLRFMNSDDERLLGRGQIYLMLNRFLSTKTIDKKLSKI